MKALKRFAMVVPALLIGATVAMAEVTPDVPEVIKVIKKAAPDNAAIKPEDMKKVDEALPKAATAKPAKAHKVLVLTRVAGFQHSSVGLGAYAMVEMGKRTGAYEATVSNDLANLAPEKLKEFDAVILCNMTGHWLEPKDNEVAGLSALGKDKAEITKAALASLLAFVDSGGGLMGFHSSSDANYEHPEFGKLIGGWFDGHPWHEKVQVKLADPTHPLLAAFEGKDFEVTDEIYQFKDPYNLNNIHELLKLDPSTDQIKKTKRADKDCAIAWVRDQGKGHVFYSSLGHREEIYWNPVLMKFYLDGMQFVLGDIKADAAPTQK
jgi:type 1 glutamine amidotransferase